MPKQYPDWTQGEPSQVTPPTADLQASGFTSGQRPAYGTLNYLFYNLGSWVRYLGSAINAVFVGTNQEASYRLVGGGTWSWNATTGTLSWSDTAYIGMAGLSDTANAIAAGSVVLSAGQLAYVQANAPFSTTGDLTAGSATVANLAYESGIAVGMAVTGNGIAAGTTVAAISQTDATLTLSAPAASSGTGINLVFAPANTLTVAAANGASLALSPNTVVLARCATQIGGTNIVYVGVGAGQMLLRDLESKPLLSNGYVTTQRLTAAVPLPAGSVVYQATSNDSVTLIRNGAATNNFLVYTDSANGVTLPANQVSVGDVVTQNTTATPTTVTAVSAGGQITLSAPLQVVSQGNSPYYNTPITLSRQPGLLYLADANLNSSVRGRALGVVTTTTPAGGLAHVVCSGTVNNYNNLTPGYTYYLSASSPGGMTVSAPTTQGQALTPIGTATSSTSMLLNAAAACQAVVLPSGYKSVIDMGYFYSTNTTATTAQNTLEALVGPGSSVVYVVRKVILAYPGSVIGLSAHLNNTITQPTTASIGKATGTMCNVSVTQGTNDAYATFAKGTYTFAAGDPLFGYVYFQGVTGLNVAVRMYATVEFTP